MSRKVLSVMLALMLVLSAFSVTAFAAGTGFEVEDEDEGVIVSTQVWSLSEATKVSDGVYSVDVSLTTNYVAGAISFRIDAENGAELTDVAINEDVISYAYDLAYNADGLVAIVPEPANEADEGVVVDGVIATLTYTLAGDGDTLTLVNDAKSATNPGGDLIAVRLSDNNLSTGTMIYGQRVIDENEDDIAEGDVIATVVLGEAAAAPADLAVKAAYASSGIVIDTAKFTSAGYAGVVYGFTLGSTKATAAYYPTYLEATNGGSIEVVKTPFVARPASYGTGTTIKVFNADGTLSKTYVIVLFGDTTGDGAIDKNDVSAINNAVNGSALSNELLVMAANVTVLARGTDAAKAAYLYNLDKNDVSNVNSDINNPGAVVVPKTLATAHNAYNTYYQ